jgi:hypothetical protein
MPTLGVFGLGAVELLIILAVLSMLVMVGVVGAIMAALVILGTGSRSRMPHTTTTPPPG